MKLSGSIKDHTNVVINKAKDGKFKIYVEAQSYMSISFFTYFYENNNSIKTNSKQAPFH